MYPEVEVVVEGVHVHSILYSWEWYVAVIVLDIYGYHHMNTICLPSKRDEKYEYCHGAGWNEPPEKSVVEHFSSREKGRMNQNTETVRSITLSPIFSISIS